MGGGERENWGGVGRDPGLDPGEGQNLEGTQAQERQEGEFRRNKEFREKETEESVKEQNKPVRSKEQ